MSTDTFEHLNVDFVESNFGHTVFNNGASLSVFSKEGDQITEFGVYVFDGYI